MSGCTVSGVGRGHDVKSKMWLSSAKSDAGMSYSKDAKSAIGSKDSGIYCAVGKPSCGHTCPEAQGMPFEVLMSGASGVAALPSFVERAGMAIDEPLLSVCASPRPLSWHGCPSF